MDESYIEQFQFNCVCGKPAITATIDNVNYHPGHFCIQFMCRDDLCHCTYADIYKVDIDTAYKITGGLVCSCCYLG